MRYDLQFRLFVSSSNQLHCQGPDSVTFILITCSESGSILSNGALCWEVLNYIRTFNNVFLALICRFIRDKQRLSTNGVVD